MAMKMIKTTLIAISIALTAVSLPGCGGSSNDNPGKVRSFSGFVAQQFNQTSERSDPVEINAVTLIDRDRNDPGAYDPLLSR
jgi:hypothetical protein